MSRAAWKYLWRHMRIIRRENSKAFADCMIFGAGFTKVGPDVPDGIRHVPFDEVQNEWSGTKLRMTLRPGALSGLYGSTGL